MKHDGTGVEMPAGVDSAITDLATATTLPAAFYVDPEIFAVERERVFGRSWVSVARSEALARPGDYLTYDLAGDPVVVVRDRSGSLRAFANVCRHRNMTIVEGAGNVAALQCPYHLWTYSLDGRLIGAPHMHAATGFEMGDHCLPELSVEEWQGWIFVNLDDAAEPLGPQLSGLDARYGDYGLAELVHVGSVDFESPWNWKITVENFAESYHHAGVHSAVLQHIYPGERSFAEDNAGEPWSSLDHVSVVDGLDPFTATVVFPFHMFSLLRPYGAYWFRLEVHDVDRTHLQIQALVRPELAGNEELVDGLISGVKAINEQDVAINIRTQRGLRSRFAAPGRISHLEAATFQFRRWLIGELESALG